MNPGAVDWTPALVVLGIGIVFGMAVIWRVLAAAQKAPRPIAPTPVEVRDLEGKSEALLRQLRELEDTASKRTPEQLARERYALELEAARTVLALEEREGASRKSRRKAAAAAPDRVAAVPSSRAGMRGFLWGIGSATGVLLLAFFVYQSAKPREPGGSATGEVGMSGRTASESSAPDAEEAELQAAVARNPDDVERRLALTRLYVERQEWMRVWNETARVLEHAPGNPRALAYQALVRLAMGQGQVAVTMLTKAVTTDPDFVEGYVYLALAQARMGRIKDAEATVARASKRFPERADDLRRFLAELRTNETPAAQASAVGGADNPHASLGAPGEGQEPAKASGSSARRIAGTVDLDPSLRGATGGKGVLFVFAREAGGSAGPPVAVKRLPAVFPAAFELSEADSMMGQPLPETLLIEARLDEDGDPTTRPATDPKARLDGVKVGRTNIRLVLKRN